LLDGPKCLGDVVNPRLETGASVWILSVCQLLVQVLPSLLEKPRCRDGAEHGKDLAWARGGLSIRLATDEQFRTNLDD
jgi:hypothetical protein